MRTFLMAKRIVARHLRARAIRIDRNRILALAEEIVRWIPKGFPKRDEPLGKRILHKGIPFDLVTADGRHIDLLIQIRSDIPYAETPEYVLSGGAGKMRSTGQPVVVIVLNGSSSGKRFIDATRTMTSYLTKSIEKVLAHELTHLADPQKGYANSGSDVPNPEDVDLEEYFNQPTEVRAYLQEILVELEEKLQYYNKFQSTFGRSKGLEYFLKVSDKWQEGRKYWTPRNRNYIIKSVTQWLNKQ